MERPIRRGTELVCRGKAGRRCCGGQGGAMSCGAGLPSICCRCCWRRWLCRGCRVPRLAWVSETPGTLRWPGYGIDGYAYFECRDRCYLVPGKPSVCQAACAPRINSIVARCMRSRARSSPLHSMCWTGMQGIHTCPARILNHFAMAKCLAAFHPTCRHRSAACCQRSFCERRKPPTLMQRSALPPRPLES